MSVRFLIPTYLRPFTGGSSRVELPRSPATVGAALESLWALYPGVRDRVVTEQGTLRPHINIFVGDESVRFLEGLSTRLPGDCEVSILPAISGG
jgi:sulfur-carrier protein